MTDANNRYTLMQQAEYDRMASDWSTTNRDPVVGSFDAHNAWTDYDEYLFKDVRGDLREKVLLDFGCGPGRNLVKYLHWFRRLDGVDLSQINLDNARTWITTNGGTPGNLYKSNGVDLSGVPSASYDVVMSTICFQHICVYEIRRSCLTDMLRVLKPGGYLTMQMGFGGRSYGTSSYYENNYDALQTNSGFDVSIMSVEELSQDMKSLGFTDFKYYIRPVGPGDAHANWIFFNARKPS